MPLKNKQITPTNLSLILNSTFSWILCFLKTVNSFKNIENIASPSTGFQRVDIWKIPYMDLSLITFNDVLSTQYIDYEWTNRFLEILMIQSICSNKSTVHQLNADTTPTQWYVEKISHVSLTKATSLGDGKINSNQLYSACVTSCSWGGAVG